MYVCIYIYIDTCVCLGVWWHTSTYEALMYAYMYGIHVFTYITYVQIIINIMHICLLSLRVHS